ncbi:MAG TPA: HAMP domain-containing protein [Candidatus Aquabacterium excrementipullorum]|nr:HAMP domain-containing protein [Candidatus Aquabacterium excrementipullorum]
MKLNQLKLGIRLGFGFGAVLVLTALIASIGWERLGHTLGNIQANAQSQERAREALRWEGYTLLNVNRALAIAESGGNDDVEKHFAPLIKETSAQISAIQKQLEASAENDEEKAKFADIAARRKAYVTSRDAIFQLLELDDPGAKEALTSQLMPAATRYITAIHDYQSYQRELADKHTADTKHTVGRAQWLLLALAALCLVSGGTCAWLISRSVTVPLRRAARATQAIAAGDLSRNLDADGRDEVADVLNGLDSMQRSLRDIVSDVRSATDSIKTASSEVAAGSQDLSGRTEQAASSLEQTASSMEQISGAIQHTADAARNANQLATGAASAAGQGGAVVTQVMTTMDEISESSRKVVDIIGVIDSIAFQTNILALNAAVEAARAGEQGRGFAVVASEVRALAQRVAEAAREIKTLIGASVDKVDTGSALVKNAGASMETIVDSVRRVAGIIGEITTASSEQSSGIGQVNAAVSQLDNMTQQNAALVEQSAAAAESLKDQADTLARVVSVFKLPA